MVESVNTSSYLQKRDAGGRPWDGIIPLAPVPGVDVGYYADIEGRIYSDKSGTIRELTKHLGKDGYNVVYLYHGGCKVKLRVSRTIGIIFDPEGFEEAGTSAEWEHMDRDRSNDAFQNGRWVSRQENMAIMWAHKRGVELVLC